MRGFTLAELMVVIAIISLLAVVSLGYIGGQLAKGRDARRRAELEQIRTALEMYRADNLAIGYPNLLTELQTGYIRQVPNDPLPDRYLFLYIKQTRTSYCIGAFLERDNPDVVARDCPTICGMHMNCVHTSPVVECNYCVSEP